MRVRPYYGPDFPKLVALGKRMHQESDFARFSYETSFLLRLSDAALTNPDCACFLAEIDGEPIGFGIFGVLPFFFGPDRHACDLVLYVAPEHRGTTAAARILKASKDWAISRGARQLRYGAATGINPDVADRFFRGMGFRQGGVLYLQDLD